jgi:hypothetical protein
MAVDYSESYDGSAIGPAFPLLDGSSYQPTTGSGALRFALGADAPLGPLGPGAWSGAAPLAWRTFAYDDAGQVQSCGDLLGPVTVDDRGQSPAPGHLAVDAVTKDPAAAPGIAVVLRADRLPAYAVAETTHTAVDHITCHDGTITTPRDFASFVSALDGADGVSTVSLAPDEHASDTYRVTGWLPGAPSGGSPGVYAYRDLPFTDVDLWGQTWTGHVHLELDATPAP